jgi:hypothetical protein
LDVELLVFYLGSLSLCLYIPVYFLLLPGVVSKFQTSIKVFDPLWVDIGTGWDRNLVCLLHVDI